MNYRHGFKRLYVAGVPLWIGAVLSAIIYRDWQPDALFNGGWTFLGLRTRAEFKMQWRSILAVSTIPPILGYFVLFGVIPWIVRGFCSKSRQSPSKL